MTYRLLLPAFLCLLLVPSLASADLLDRDSVYYTLDDGIMSPEEMAEEASGIFSMCDMNLWQKQYFNCECLAGAFLLEREKRGPMAQQTEIYDDITKKKPAACANTEYIAGDSYKYCMEQTAPRRPLSTDNPEYCSCVANKVANDFTKKPYMGSSYIQHLEYDARFFCDKPENRVKKTAAKTAN